MASIGCLINIALLVGYLLFFPERSAWPTSFAPAAWLPFVLYGYLTHFFDGLQNTTRNLARIYLLESDGLAYDSSLVEPIQHTLIPDTLVFPIFLWQLSGVVSFAALLFFQGWIAPVAAHGVLIALGGFLPIDYNRHLRRIKENLERRIPPEEILSMGMKGVSLLRVRELVDQALKEGRDPQRWWGQVLANERKSSDQHS